MQIVYVILILERNIIDTFFAKSVYTTFFFKQQPPNADGIEFSGSMYPTKPFVSYRTMNNLTYPVNVGRNIARQSATSHFVFPSDIELYPSPGMRRKHKKVLSGKKLIVVI